MSWDTVATCIPVPVKTRCLVASRTGREVDVPRPRPLRVVVLVGNPPEGVFEAQQTDDSDLGCSRGGSRGMAVIQGGVARTAARATAYPIRRQACERT